MQKLSKKYTVYLQGEIGLNSRPAAGYGGGKEQQEKTTRKQVAFGNLIDPPVNDATTKVCGVVVVGKPNIETTCRLSVDQ